VLASLPNRRGVTILKHIHDLVRDCQRLVLQSEEYF
jgi:hypothetical protein